MNSQSRSVRLSDGDLEQSPRTSINDTPEVKRAQLQHEMDKRSRIATKYFTGKQFVTSPYQTTRKPPKHNSHTPNVSGRKGHR